MRSTCPKCIAPVHTSREAIGVNLLDLESGGELLRGAASPSTDMRSGGRIRAPSRSWFNCVAIS